MAKIFQGSQGFDKDLTKTLASIFLKVAYKIFGRSLKTLEDLGCQKIIDMEIFSVLTGRPLNLERLRLGKMVS